MTLSRLVLAWLLVAVEFALVDGLASGVWAFTKWGAVWRALEAATVTLLASLWFASLGHGGWWLLFALLGLCVALARFPGAAPDMPRRRDAIVTTVRDVARYVLAGAILAWRLG